MRDKISKEQLTRDFQMDDSRVPEWLLKASERIIEHTNLLLLVITICVGSYAFINTAVWELFEREITRYFSPFIYNIMEIAFMVGIGCLGYVFYKD